jgi:hypothetical protein
VIPNLFVSFLKKLAKLLTGLYLVVRWRTLEYLRVFTLRKHFEIFYLPIIIAFLLCSNWTLFLVISLVIYFVYLFVQSDWFGASIRMSIHSTRGYSYWPAYDPLSSRVSTLEKVATKVKFEDSGAYRSLIRMSSGIGFVHKYLLNRGTDGAKSKKEVKTSKSGSKRGGVSTPPTTRKQKTSKRGGVITPPST